MRRLILPAWILSAMLPVVVFIDAAHTSVLDPCLSNIQSPAALSPIVVCPQGDGTRLDEAGGPIVVQILDYVGAPVPGIPALDFWIIDCTTAANELSLCGGVLSVSATGPTDENGITSIADPIAAAGCVSGLAVVAQGIVIVGPQNCQKYFWWCVPATVRSPDRNRDMVVDIIDFSLFGIAFPSPPASYDACFDFDDNGVIDLVDFATFGIHFLHGC